MLQYKVTFSNPSSDYFVLWGNKTALAVKHWNTVWCTAQHSTAADDEILMYAKARSATATFLGVAV